jgi:hypothetical protein
MADEADEIDDGHVYRPTEVPKDVWQAARRHWQCDPKDQNGYRQPKTNVGQQRLLITARAIMAERKRSEAICNRFLVGVPSNDTALTARSIRDLIRKGAQ